MTKKYVSVFYFGSYRPYIKLTHLATFLEENLKMIMKNKIECSSEFFKGIIF